MPDFVGWLCATQRQPRPPFPEVLPLGEWGVTLGQWDKEPAGWVQRLRYGDGLW